MPTEDPAKYSRALIQRIYQHLTAERWLRAGDTVLDPFGGVALGGLDAGLAGYRWVGVELEPRFIALGQENITLWQRRYGHLPEWITPTVVQGDSRQLQTVLAGQVECCVSSPPYTHNEKHDYRVNDEGGRDRDVRRGYRQGLRCFRGSETYGHMPGQLGRMAEGTLTAAIASPPYANGCTHTGGIDPSPTHIEGGPVHHVDYGQTPGQLGAMEAGKAEAVVSSPPWEDQLVNDHTPEHYEALRAKIYRDGKSHGGKFGVGHPYGDESPGQLGTTHGNTFWSAARTILEQTYAILKPGGHAIFVVKAYCRDGQIVDFPGDWRRLCERVGFVTLHEHHAMLVEDHGTQRDLFGPDRPEQTARKSFFRRLHEAKRPDLAINYETVYCMQKPVYGKA